jgi:hypothetical protein
MKTLERLEGRQLKLELLQTGWCILAMPVDLNCSNSRRPNCKTPVGARQNGTALK